MAGGPPSYGRSAAVARPLLPARRMQGSSLGAAGGRPAQAPGAAHVMALGSSTPVDGTGSSGSVAGGGSRLVKQWCIAGAPSEEDWRAPVQNAAQQPVRCFGYPGQHAPSPPATLLLPLNLRANTLSAPNPTPPPPHARVVMPHRILAPLPPRPAQSTPKRILAVLVRSRPTRRHATTPPVPGRRAPPPPEAQARSSSTLCKQQHDSRLRVGQPQGS